jgi:hypothetical protein
LSARTMGRGSEAASHAPAPCRFTGEARGGMALSALTATGAAPVTSGRLV